MVPVTQLVKDAFISDASFDASITRAEESWTRLAKSVSNDLVALGVVDIEHKFGTSVKEAYKETLPKDWAFALRMFFHFFGLLPEDDGKYTAFGVWRAMVKFDAETLAERVKGKLTRKALYDALVAKPRQAKTQKTGSAELIAHGTALGNCAKARSELLMADLSVLTPAEMLKFRAGYDAMRRMMAALAPIIDPPETPAG